MRSFVFRIVGQRWVLRLFEFIGGDRRSYGRADCSTREVWINSLTPPVQARDTLLHELIHIAADATEVHLHEVEVERLSMALSTCDLLEIKLPWERKVKRGRGKRR